MPPRVCLALNTISVFFTMSKIGMDYFLDKMLNFVYEQKIYYQELVIGS